MFKILIQEFIKLISHNQSHSHIHVLILLNLLILLLDQYTYYVLHNSTDYIKYKLQTNGLIFLMAIKRMQNWLRLKIHDQKTAIFIAAVDCYHPQNIKSFCVYSPT